MNKQDLINCAVRCALMTGATVAAIGYASTTLAANANTPANLGKVTVTGTRIKRTNVETAQPITRINHQQIQRSGYTNLANLLGRLSFAGSSARGGLTTSVNLRGLGANRNLVLVNGKRWIQGLGGATNLNTIPTSIIDHIEILQDGASAVYGSDAITGVVNIITTKNFNGAEVHAYYGIRNDHQTGSWGGQVKQYDFTVGSGNDRGNVVFNVTYREQNRILNTDRKLTRTPIAGEPAYFRGAAGTFPGRFSLFGSAVSGRTFGQGTCGAYNPARPSDTLCDLTLQNVPAQPSTQNFRNFTPTDRYNFKQTRGIRQPVKDVTAYVQGHYDLFDNVTFTANAAYIRNEGTQEFNPDVVVIGSTAGKFANGQPIGIATSNPYNPFGVDLVADTTDPCIAAGSCIGLGVIRRRTAQAGLRYTHFSYDYFHILAGFNGYVNLFNREVD